MSVESFFLDHGATEKRLSSLLDSDKTKKLPLKDEKYVIISDVHLGDGGTADDFRKLALSFPEAAESAHMHHPDFRVCGKIFATLGYPEENSAVVKLTPEEQRDLVRGDPNVFQPVKGA